MISTILIIFQIIIFCRLSKYRKRIQALEDRYLENEIDRREVEPFYQPIFQEAVVLGDDEATVGFWKRLYPHKLFNIIQNIYVPQFIQENWLGLVGAISCVMGFVFFGIISGFLNNPLARVAVMLSFCLGLIWVSVKLQAHVAWHAMCNILRSTAAAIMLFVSLGVGSIDGLRCVHSSLGGLGILCVGISINIYLAMRSISQVRTSLHVVLSVLVLCLIPQNILLLPLGALIVVIGLLKARKSVWDIHLVMIIGSFSLQNMIWSQGIEKVFWVHIIGIICSIIVGVIAGAIHYNKQYQSVQVKPWSLLAHLTNWLLLIWNVYTYAEFTQWGVLILFLLSMSGFYGARMAKKRGIFWLYYTDTLVAQLIALSFILSLHAFHFRLQDLCVIALLEIVIFSTVYNFLKEVLFVRLGYFMQIGLCFSFLVASLFDGFSSLSLYRIGSVVAICWGFYFYINAKKFSLDTLTYLLQYTPKNQVFSLFWHIQKSVSITAIFGVIFFFLIYGLGSELIPLQCILMGVVCGIGLWRAFREDATVNLIFLTLILGSHFYQWGTLIFQKNIGLRIDVICLVFIDVILIFRDKLKMQLFGENIHGYMLYMLALHLGILTQCSLQMGSVLVPAVAYLGYALLALEMERVTSLYLQYEKSIKIKIRESLFFIGLMFLSAFILNFIAVHLQVESLWHNFPIRWMSEILGVGVLCYWLVFMPNWRRNPVFQLGIFQCLLGFISLIILVECQEVWRPLLWGLISLGLLIGNSYVQWPKRLYVYSWGYLIASIFHGTFVGGMLVLPNSSFIERYYTPLVIALVIQLIVSYFFHLYSNKSLQRVNATSLARESMFFRQASLLTLLPIFLGLAWLFAFNYEKSLLTLVWAALSGIYLAFCLLSKSKRGIQIAMSGLGICSIRLLFFDLIQSDLLARALVFLGVGVFMLSISMVYKKYKYRIGVS